MDTSDRIPDIYTFKDLQHLCGGGSRKISRPRVEKWARQQGIRFAYDGQGGIWTTRDAINTALGVCKETSFQPYNPEDIA